MDREQHYDTIVIGGGPGGSSSASYLSLAGKRVLLLEKEIFPRFHIGESLLPYNTSLFEELGLLPKLKAAGLIKKTGAQFHIGNGSCSAQFIFRNGRFTKQTEAFQVERATFDHILLQHARSLGAEIREGWTVTRFKTNPRSVTVEARDPEGKSHDFAAAFLIDASGRGNMTGNQEGMRELHQGHNKLAIFAHFTGVKLDPGERGTDTVIVRLENKWFWVIPLTTEKTSVGCVMDAAEFAAAKESPQLIFDRIWQSSAVMRDRLKDAVRIGNVQVTSDFSYHNRRFASPRLLRVGDAAGFMDPIFSSGVYLAMYSGKLASELVIEAIAASDDGGTRLAKYERRIWNSMQIYWQLIDGFYTKPFMDLFMTPANHLSLPAAVTALLAGELEGGWKLRWRMWVFAFLVWLQKRWAFVPRVSWEPVAEKRSGCSTGDKSAAEAEHAIPK